MRWSVADAHHAEDIVADVMLRIHQHLGELDDRERVTAWMFRIARNAITDRYRQQGPRRETPDTDLDLVTAPDADS